MRKLGREESLLGSEDLEIGRAAVLHHEICSLVGSCEGLDLVLVEVAFLFCRLVGDESLVYLIACGEDSLCPSELGLLLLSLGNLDTCADLTVLEDWLHEACRCLPEELARFMMVEPMRLVQPA